MPFASLASAGDVQRRSARSKTADVENSSRHTNVGNASSQNFPNAPAPSPRSSVSGSVSLSLVRAMKGMTANPYRLDAEGDGASNHGRASDDSDGQSDGGKSNRSSLSARSEMSTLSTRSGTVKGRTTSASTSGSSNKSIHMSFCDCSIDIEQDHSSDASKMSLCSDFRQLCGEGGQADALLQCLEMYGFEKPWKLQQRAIPAILQVLGRQLNGLTGSAGKGKSCIVIQGPARIGKTSAVVLALIASIDPSIPRPQAILLTTSSKRDFDKYLSVFTLMQSVAFQSFMEEDDDDFREESPKIKAALQSHILVGHPRKVLRLLSGVQSLCLDSVKALVIDDAEELLYSTPPPYSAAATPDLRRTAGQAPPGYLGTGLSGGNSSIGGGFSSAAGVVGGASPRGVLPHLIERSLKGPFGSNDGSAARPPGTFGGSSSLSGDSGSSKLPPGSFSGLGSLRPGNSVAPSAHNGSGLSGGGPCSDCSAGRSSWGPSGLNGHSGPLGSGLNSGCSNSGDDLVQICNVLECRQYSQNLSDTYHIRKGDNQGPKLRYIILSQQLTDPASRKVLRLLKNSLMKKKNLLSVESCLPPTKLIKAMKHYYVLAPRTEWVHVFSSLVQSLMFPRALVFCDDEGGGPRGFLKTMQALGLAVSANLPDVPGPRGEVLSASESRRRAVQEFTSNKSQFLLTRSEPAVCQLVLPKVSCVFHFGVPSQLPSVYGIRLLPLDANLVGDSASILFVEPSTGASDGTPAIVAGIGKLFDIRFMDMPFEFLPAVGKAHEPLSPLSPKSGRPGSSMPRSGFARLAEPRRTAPAYGQRVERHGSAGSVSSADSGSGLNCGPLRRTEIP